MINGKKSYIGIIGYATVEILVATGVISPDVADPLRVAFGSLAGIGLAHKLDKNITASKSRG